MHNHAEWQELQLISKQPKWGKNGDLSDFDHYVIVGARLVHWKDHM